MINEPFILHTVMEANILPLTSACDSKCIFCSHHDNPEGIRTIGISPRTLDEIDWALSFLDGSSEIAIGESATAIMEGEPTCHPQFAEIIRKVRGKFPKTLISITTNGHNLDNNMVSFLKEVMPIEIKLSLNSSTVSGRYVLMGDNESLAERTIDGVKLLNKYQIPFHGSIVAMPHVVGWEDISQTIRYLSENGALAIRIFMAGYSKKASKELQFDAVVMHRELKNFVENMVDKITCPLLMEPSLITCLTPIVNAVTRDSVSFSAGIKRGDIIKKVNGDVPRSRVEGWNFLQQQGKIITQIDRNGQYIDISWDNVEDEDCGIIMEYDFDMGRMQELHNLINSCSGKTLILSSELGFQVMLAVLKLIDNLEGRVDIKATKNNLFGGSIKAAGLLNVTDFDLALKNYCRCHERPDLILIPQEAFDCQGYDLMGNPYWKLTEDTGIDVKLS